MKKYVILFIIVLVCFTIALSFYIKSSNIHKYYPIIQCNQSNEQFTNGYHKTALLLTIFNTPDREDMYIKTIKWWIDNSNLDIYVVNSFNNPVKYTNNRVKVFTFNQHDFEPENKSSTVYELLSLIKASEYFKHDFKKYSMILKLTGKYIVPDLLKYIYTIPCNTDIVIQNNHTFFTQNTELIGFSVYYLEDMLLFLNRDVNDMFEKLIIKLLHSNKYSVKKFPKIHIPDKYRISRADHTVLSFL